VPLGASTQVYVQPTKPLMQTFRGPGPLHVRHDVQADTFGVSPRLKTPIISSVAANNFVIALVLIHASFRRVVGSD
jgi:hypothetical protein